MIFLTDDKALNCQLASMSPRAYFNFAPLVIAAAIALAPGSALAADRVPGVGDEVEGPAVAVDGAHLAIPTADGPLVIRLASVIVPSIETWPHGPLARGFLDSALDARGPTIRCRIFEVNGPLDLVGDCWLVERPEHSLAELLIAAGLAVENRSEAIALYAGAEAMARAARLGVWRSGGLEAELPALIDKGAPGR